MERAGHTPEDVVTIIVERGAVEITKITTKRLDALEQWVGDVATATPHMEEHAALERELVELKDDEQLAMLDQAEGCDRVPPLYERVEVTVRGRAAWLYVYAGDAEQRNVSDSLLHVQFHGEAGLV